jgi:Transposase
MRMVVWGSPSCVTGCSPRTAARAEAIAVAIAVPHDPVVEALLERGFWVHAINPKQLDRFRDRFTVAGAKDDRRDARVLANSLRTAADGLLAVACTLLQQHTLFDPAHQAREAAAT